MKFHYTEDKLPELFTDVLGFYGVGRDEFQVLYLDDEGEWYRRMDGAIPLTQPDFWAELPSPEEVYDDD